MAIPPGVKHQMKRLEKIREFLCEKYHKMM